MEEEFNVRTASEGTFQTSVEINNALNTMGCTAFTTRHFGSVKAVVAKEGGVITKQRLIWGDDNDAKFQEIHQKAADELLAATVKAVAGGVDPGEGSIKFLVKK